MKESPTLAQGLRRAVGYLRRSTDRQEQSIPDQRKSLQQYAEANSIQVVDFYVDDAISGTTTIGRKAFLQMISDAQKPNRSWNLIVVYDVKRFGRTDNDEAGYYRHILRMHGVEICYVTENFSGDATDDLLRPVKQWQAREESKDLSKVTIRGLLSKIQGGWWMGGAPPLGYDLRYENDRGEFLFILRHMPDGSKQVLNESGKLVRTLARGESLSISKRDHAKLVPGDPERMNTVQAIFRMYVTEGKGYRAIADSLNRAGVPTPRNSQWSSIYDGKWGDSTVREILINPVYTGDMVWNRRTDGRFHKITNGVASPRTAIHSQRLVPNDCADWITIRSTHPALITRHDFDAAHERRSARGSGAQHKEASRGGWSGARSRFILSGLLFCGACGKPYHGCYRTKGRPRKDGSQIRTYYYNCSGYIRCGAHVCTSRHISQETVEALVTRTTLDHYGPLIGATGRRRIEEAVQELVGAGHKDLAKARKRMLAQQRQIERTINNLLDNITAENRDLVDRRLKTLRHEMAECTSRLEQLDTLASSQGQVREAVEDVVKVLGALERTFSDGVPEEKRVALRRCIEKIVIDRDCKKAAVLVRRVPLANAPAASVEANLNAE